MPYKLCVYTNTVVHTFRSASISQPHKNSASRRDNRIHQSIIFVLLNTSFKIQRYSVGCSLCSSLSPQHPTTAVLPYLHQPSTLSLQPQPLAKREVERLSSVGWLRFCSSIPCVQPNSLPHISEFQKEFFMHALLQCEAAKQCKKKQNKTKRSSKRKRKNKTNNNGRKKANIILPFVSQ